MSRFIVCKFGGTSMGTAAAMQSAAEIVAAKPGVRLVIVSATSGTTNQLLRIAEAQSLKSSDLAQAELEQLKRKHREIANGLSVPARVIATIEKIFAEMESAFAALSDQNLKALDHWLSFGEILSSILFVQALNLLKPESAECMDAKLYLCTNSHFGKAEPKVNEMRKRISSLSNQMRQTNLVRVTQGFIGADADGNCTTLGRGGSDYSAALFAEALDADELEIWTDVPGILTMDPRVVPSAKIIPEISFAEAAEMANFGAKVLHPATLWPAVRAKIPVFVGSTFEPAALGTRILPMRDPGAPLIRAIAVRKKQTLITVSSLRMLNTHGFLAKMFEILARHHLSIDLVTTSEISVALTVDEGALGSSGLKVSDQIEMLKELREIADVFIEEELSLIAIIGNSLNRSSGVAAKVFQAIHEFNVRLICHGASEHNICFLVASSQAAEVAKRLHHVCIEWSSR